jgi:HEAT repeat protein
MKTRETHMGRARSMAHTFTLAWVLIAAVACGSFAQTVTVPNKRTAPRAKTPPAMTLDQVWEIGRVPVEAMTIDMNLAPIAIEEAAVALDQLNVGIAQFAPSLTSTCFPAASSLALAQMDFELAQVSTSMGGSSFFGQELQIAQERAAGVSQDSKVGEAYQKAYNLVLDRKWTEAQNELDAFIDKYPRTSYTDGARYWRCYAREKKGDPAEEVFKAYQDFVTSYSHSKWVDDAKTSMIRIGSQLAKSGKSEYGAMVKSMQEGEDEDVKLAALYALRNTGEEKSLPVIVSLYDQSKSDKLREKIVYVLGSINSPDVIPKLADIAVKDKSSSVRKNAVYALGNTHRPEAAASLKQIVKSQADIEIRTTALYSLANVGGADMVSFLADIAKNDPNEKLARTAAYSVANVNSDESSKALQAILKEAKFREVRKAALNAMGNRGDASVVSVLKDVALTESDRDMRRSAVYALGNIHSPSSLEALKAIITASTDSATREAAMQAIGMQGGSESREILKKYVLSEQDEQLAKGAIYALGNSREAADSSFYLDVLRNAKSLEVRKAALYQFANAAGPGEGRSLGYAIAAPGRTMRTEREGKTDKSSVVTTLSKIIKEEKDSELKVAAIYVLGNLRSDEAVSVLLDIAMNDSNKKARTSAVSALSNIGTPKAQDALVQILSGKTKEQEK